MTITLIWFVSVLAINRSYPAPAPVGLFPVLGELRVRERTHWVMQGERKWDGGGFPGGKMAVLLVGSWNHIGKSKVGTWETLGCRYYLVELFY